MGKNNKRSARPPKWARQQLQGPNARAPKNGPEAGWQQRHQFDNENAALLNGTRSPQDERERQYLQEHGRVPRADGSASKRPFSPGSDSANGTSSKRISLPVRNGDETPTHTDGLDETVNGGTAGATHSPRERSPRASQQQGNQGLPGADGFSQVEDDFQLQMDDDEDYPPPKGSNGSGEVLDEHQEQVQVLRDQILSEAKERAEQQKLAGVQSPMNQAQRKSKEQDDELQQLMETLQTNDNNAFAEPLRECMRHFQNKAIATSLAESQPPKVLDATSDSSPIVEISFRIKDMLSIAPHDWDLEAWAPDNILDVKIALANQEVLQHDAYIAPIGSLSVFVCRSDFEYMNTDSVKQLPGESIQDSLFRCNCEDKHRAIDSADDPFDPSLYPAGLMPPNTKRLLLVYNISQVHWVSVEIEIDDAKENGHVRLYNTMSNRQRGHTLSILAKELPQLLSLIKKRPDLGWADVNFSGPIPEVMECPQQTNTTDCGFWSVFLAKQVALSQSLTGGVLDKVAPTLYGQALRWDVMRDIYQHVLLKQLTSPGPVEVAEALGDSNSAANNGHHSDNEESGKGKSGSNSKKGNPPGSRSKSSQSGNKAKNNKSANKGRKGKSGGKPKKGMTYRLPKNSRVPIADSESDSEGSDTEPHFKELGDDWRFNLRQIACDVLVGQNHLPILTQDRVQELVLDRVKNLAEEASLSVDEQESVIFERTLAVLERTPAIFKRYTVLQDEDLDDVEDPHGSAGPWYRVNNGPGRLVSTEAIRAFLSPPSNPPQLIDCIAKDVLLVVSVVRSSGDQGLEEAFDGMYDRAESQVFAFHNAFGNRTSMPQEIADWSDVDVEDIYGSSGYWMDYCFCDSSTAVLLDVNSPGQAGDAGKRVRKLLDDANDWARTLTTRPQVVILTSGVDGATSNNATWSILRDRYKALDLCVTVVCQQKRSWNREYFFVDSDTGAAWTTVSIGRLADLYLIESRNGDLEDAHSDDSTESRYLTATTLVQCFKEDYSLQPQFEKLHLDLRPQHQVACQLTGTYRKSFPLSNKQKRCEVCGLVAHENHVPTMTWSRGSSFDTAVVCEEHCHLSAEITRHVIDSSFAGMAARLTNAVALGENGRPQYICRTCGKKCRSDSRLQNHERLHSEDRPHVCEICQKGFKSARDLRAHSKIHSEERPHICSVCDKGFKSAGELSRHAQYHAEPTHICEVCEKGFKTASDLRRHSKIHSEERPHICEICEKAFRLAEELRMHAKFHSEERPHVCEVCEKGFKSAGDLRGHLYTHSEERPHVCEVCEKGFRTVRDLQDHKTRRHSDERPHICEVCEKDFKTVRDLRRHKKRHS